MRKTIRETVAEVLEESADLLAVKIGRRHAFDISQLNAATVFTDSEKSEADCMDAGSYENTLALTVRLYIKPRGSDLGEDTVDAILDEMDPLVIAALRDLDDVINAELTALDIEGDTADADYILATRIYAVVYNSEI